MVCPPYAKIPSGEPITVEWLTSVLRPPDGPLAVRWPVVTSFQVDEASVIEGRHSTTFRLRLEWSPSPDAEGGAAQPAVGESSGSPSDDAGESSAAAGRAGVGDSSGSWNPMPSVFVKRMTCSELPARSLIKWRTSISSYRAEATFFKTIAAGSHAAPLDGIVPHVFWVHVDDRLGEGATGGSVGGGTTGVGGVSGGRERDEEDAAVVKTLRESCFMMVTEDLCAETSDEQHPEAGAKGEGASVGGWEQVCALDLSRAKGVLAAVAHLHASFWPNPEASAVAGPEKIEQQQQQQRQQRQQQQQQQRQQVERQPDADSDGGKPRSREVQGGGGRGGAGESGGRYAKGLHEQGTFWSLEKRDPGDLVGLEQTYERLLRDFRPLLPADWFSDSPPHAPPGGAVDADAAPAVAADGGGEVGEVSGADSGGADGCRHRHRPSRSGSSGVGRERSLGRRLAARALELDAAVHAPPSERRMVSPEQRGLGRASSSGDSGGGGGGRRGRSLVHGDLKSWNLFFSTGGWGNGEEGATAATAGGTPAAGGKVKIIDWQWCGEGVAAADVAYVVCTCLEPSVLLSREGELLRHYHAELSRGLEARLGKRHAPPTENGGGGGGGGGGAPVDDGGGGGMGVWYSFEQFLDDYRVAFLDYMRCVVGTLWKGLTPEKMDRNRSTGPGLSLINRSPQHLQWMIGKASRLLDELDDLDRT